jgi:hypothetical protein
MEPVKYMSSLCIGFALTLPLLLLHSEGVLALDALLLPILAIIAAELFLLRA